MKYHVTIKTQDGRRIKTWGVFPVSNATKVLDGIFDPEAKRMTILLDSATEQYTDFPIAKSNGQWEVQQRKLDQYYKFHLTEEDIPFFLDTYVENNFDIEPEVEQPPRIVTEST